ncbi:twin-arginine translocation signal domain-containing protein [Bradyrhizobium iriomotense]
MTTRRQFLKRTAAGAAGLSLSGLNRRAFAAADDVIRITPR